jgi:hypothetical protein
MYPSGPAYYRHTTCEGEALGVINKFKISANDNQGIDSDTRVQLLRLIDIEGMRIKDAAAYLKLNYHTAKSIIRRYRVTGKIERANRKQCQLDGFTDEEV